MAVAGFAQEDLDITQERNVLLVKGQKAEAKDCEYLHRGIAGRSFERKFELADRVRGRGRRTCEWSSTRLAEARASGSREAAQDRDRREVGAPSAASDRS
jgi:hypothetical protein